MKASLWNAHFCFVVLLVLLGVALRTWNFATNPGGMNQDELGTIYEAFALWTEGTDRWGLPWPSYFPAWGSGQNALLTYLSIPFVAVFGPSVFIVRGIVLVSALATLPLIYVSARLAFGRMVALLALFFTAILPWHIMMSRWGLESNLLPFFWLATIVSFQLALLPGSSKAFKFAMPLLAALCLYAYSASVFTVTVFIFLALLFFRVEMLKAWRGWAMGFGAGLFIGLPLLHFLLKNHVFKSNLWIDHFAPWTAPLLPITRLAQLSGGYADVIKANFVNFLGSYFSDGLVWNTFPGHHPVPAIVCLLVPFGIVATVLEARKGVRGGLVVLIALIAAFASLFFFFVNVNRVNAIYLPLIIIAARGACFVSLDSVKKFGNFVQVKTLGNFVQGQKWQGVLGKAPAGILILSIVYPCFLFARDYFRDYPKIMANVFRVGAPEAIHAARALAAKGQLPILFDESIFMNYIYVLTAEQIRPSTFLANSNANTSRFAVSQIGQWRFSKSYLQTLRGAPFVFVNLTSTPPLCPVPSTVQTHGSFVAGICQ